MGIICNDENILLSQYLFELFNETINLSLYSSGANPPSITAEAIKSIKIPLPPLEVQEKIVSEFEKLENEIAVRKERLENLKNTYSEILDKYLK